MGFEIDNNNGANCYRATAVLLPPAFGTFGTLQRLKLIERRKSEITCDVLIIFRLKLC